MNLKLSIYLGKIVFVLLNVEFDKHSLKNPTSKNIYVSKSWK